MRFRSIAQIFAVGGFCLLSDFVLDTVHQGNSFSLSPIKNASLVVKSKILPPAGARCATVPNLIWRAETGNWSKPSSFAQLPNHLQLWLLHRLGEISPRLFDWAVARLTEGGDPILVITKPELRTQVTAFSAVRSLLLGDAYSYRLLSCMPFPKSEAQIHFPAGDITGQLLFLDRSPILGRWTRIEQLTANELSSRYDLRFGRLNILFPGAKTVEFNYSPGFVQLTAFQEHRALHVDCGANSLCKFWFTRGRDAEEKLTSEFPWSQPADFGISDISERPPTGRLFARMLRSRICRMAKSGELLAIQRAWAEMNANDLQASSWIVRSKDICFSESEESAERFDDFFQQRLQAIGADKDSV